jgi:hypothetical protein
MARKFIGYLKAFIKAPNEHDKPRYIPIGAVFQDPENPQDIASKLDALPLASIPWDGWANVYAPRDSVDDFAPKPKEGVTPAKKKPLNPVIPSNKKPF